MEDKVWKSFLRPRRGQYSIGNTGLQDENQCASAFRVQSDAPGLASSSTLTSHKDRNGEVFRSIRIC